MTPWVALPWVVISPWIGRPWDTTLLSLGGNITREGMSLRGLQVRRASPRGTSVRGTSLRGIARRGLHLPRGGHHLREGAALTSALLRAAWASARAAWLCQCWLYRLRHQPIAEGGVVHAIVLIDVVGDAVEDARRVYLYG